MVISAVLKCLRYFLFLQKYRKQNININAKKYRRYIIFHSKFVSQPHIITQQLQYAKQQRHNKSTP
jgi:hypothetical protein